MSNSSLSFSSCSDEEKLNKASIPGGDAADEYENWMKSKQLIKPDDQLDLTEAELNEEIPKVLLSENTNYQKNLVVYSFREGEYVNVPKPPNIITLFDLRGTALHIESDEAKLQILEQGSEIFDDEPVAAAPTIERGEGEDDDEAEAPEEVAAEPEPGPEAEAEPGPEAGPEPETEAEADPDDEEGAAAAETAEAPKSKKKQKLINQFNYCERAALTYNNPSRPVETQTIPPPRSTYGGCVLQWEIYDSYARDFEQQQKEKEKEKKGTKKDEKKRVDKAQETEELNKKYLQCWQILERMVNQNIFDDIAHDYRYWEDPSDEFRDQEGTLLPLWKFNYEKTKKMNVTDICFNPHYYDMFAVCFGSNDFMKQYTEGYVCLFTIKNPSFPDYRILTESGVMCCDIHPKYPYLLAIGMYDGNVAVYNLKTSQSEPLYLSKGVNGKHSDLVWELKWGPDMIDGEINFYTISADGRVFNWILMQNRLAITTIITLLLDKEMTGGPDGLDMKLRACGTCMIFHPKMPEIFLVGTEEGLVFKCSTAYSSRYLMTYQAHYLAVYKIDYNKFNSNIFASASADWRVKIWEDMRNEPLFIFDLGASVGDVKWAPFSSTVLAAITSEGKVFVFDVNINKYKAICIQQVVARKTVKLTRLAFNFKLPFIIIGDDKGMITSLKLSPNLRMKVKPPKKQQSVDQSVLQAQKLEKLLSLVREIPDENFEKEMGTTAAS